MIPSAPEFGALLLRGPDQPGVGIGKIPICRQTRVKSLTAMAN